MSDSYRTITVTLRDVQKNVIVVVNSKGRGHGICTIPRSLLHGADDMKLAPFVDPGVLLPIEYTLRVRDWKAEELGFA